jgi:hypothetical protein
MREKERERALVPCGKEDHDDARYLVRAEESSKGMRKRERDCANKRKGRVRAT